MRSAFGHIQKLSKGHYRAHWNDNGVKRSKRCRSYEEATEVIARARLLKGNIDYQTTYNKYYSAVIIPSYKHLAKRSVHELQLAGRDLKPIIGDKKINDTSGHLVQSTIDGFYAPSRQRRAFVFGRRMLNFAVKDEIIQINPCCQGIKLKKTIRKPKILYSKEELLYILNYIRGTEFALPVLLECCCGLRHEEFCGLNRKDFDFEDEGGCYITISSALTNVGGSKVLKDTKTSTSARIVCLHSSFKPYYLMHMEFMKNKRALREYGDPCKLSRKGKEYCAKNKLKYVPFGNMRSVYATLCAEAGCLDSIVSKSMGHTGGSVKDRNYQTATMKALKLNAETFADYVDFKPTSTS